MKKLFALLVLLNLAVFAWDFQRSENAAGSREIPQLEGVPRITLVSELPAPTAPQQAPTGDPIVATDSQAEAVPSVLGAPLSVETTQSPFPGPPSKGADSPSPGVSSEPEPHAAVAQSPPSQGPASATDAAQVALEGAAVEEERRAPRIEEERVAAGKTGAAAPVPPQASTPEAEEAEIQVAAVESPPVQVEVERLERRCISIGPFALRNEATQAELALTKKFGQSINLRKEVAKVQIGYWVVIPPQGTTAQAIEKVDELKRAGITDLWRFTRGELANAISLGLFTGRRYAERQRDEIAKKGFDPEVRPRYTDQNRYWLDLTLRSGEEISDSDWRAGIEESSEAEQTAVECR